MKKTMYLYILVIGLLMTACYQEDPIEPTPPGSSSAERFAFPQGTNDYDMAAQKIFEDFGVKIIYKGFNERDFNLTWTTPALGKVGNDIPKDQEKDAVDFMVNQFFAFLTPQISRKVLPPYYYIADSVRQKTILNSNNGEVENQGTTNFIYTGLDFWFVGWNNASSYMKYVATGAYITGPSVPELRPKTPFAVFYRRGTIIKEVYKKAVEIGNIVPPVGFADGLDFVTKVESAVAKKDDPNYYMKRGFPGYMNNTLNFKMNPITVVTQTSPVLIFTNYIHLCMRYTPDSIAILYPQKDYPIIHEKYPIVLEHMKTKYNIDLTKIATKPEKGYQ